MPLTVDEIAHLQRSSIVMIVGAFPSTTLSPGGSIITGTGIVLDTQGHIVTMAHVGEGTSEIKIYASGDRHPRVGRIIARASADDLLVLKVDDTHGLLPAMLGDSDSTPLGAGVIALGFPDSIDWGEMTLTTGVLSKKGTAWGTYQNLLQHTAGLANGSSGGPLLDQQGKVIGINALYYNSGGGEPSYYAVAISYAAPILAELIHGVSRHYVGVNLIPNRYRDYFKTTNGLVVNGVTASSPSARAGIQPGDLVLNVSGVSIREVSDFYNVVRSHPVDELNVDILRVDATYVVYQCEGGFTLGDPSSGRPLTCKRLGPPPASAPPCEDTVDFHLRLCDSFDSATSNWWFGRQDYFEAAIREGRYALSIFGQRTYPLSAVAGNIVLLNGTIISNVYIEGDGVAGLLGRWTSSGDYYDCWIDNGRRFGCFAMEGGTHQPLTKAATSAAIRPNKFNMLTLTMIGGNLLFRVNGETVAEISEVPFRGGQWGLFVSTGRGEDTLTAYYEDARIWEYDKR
jgi:S1-C subfamily serine protease